VRDPLLKGFVALIIAGAHMIAETIFWMIFIGASRAIAKTYERRCDVLYGPYVRRIG
jgi:hypothetical protein